MSLTLDRVSFAYPDGPAIFQEASLTFGQGGYYLIKGPSGAGKSTLLRLLCLLEEAQSGTIKYEDQSIDAMAPPELRRKVAYVQQMPTLLPGTVRENLLLPFSFAANKALQPPTDDALNAMLASFLLTGFTLDSPGNKLSVGQSQRVCLIRSLLLEPDVLLLDEPTASLDPESATVVLDKAFELNRAGMTVIMISHSEKTPPGADRIVSIRDGRLVEA